MMSDKNYKGELSETQSDYVKNNITKEYSDKKTEILKPYKNINEIPIFRIRKSNIEKELNRIYGTNFLHGGNKDIVKASIDKFRSKIYYFYWQRFKLDPKGNPIEKNGKFQLEGVDELSPLLRIREVTDPQNRDRLLYYEIAPSAAILEGVINCKSNHLYYLTVPNNWRKEAEQAYKKEKKGNNVRTPKHLMNFLLWLRMIYSERSGKRHPNFRIKISWENIAGYIRIPQSQIEKKRKQTREKLISYYELAKKMGYLKSYNIDAPEPIDILILNPDFYNNTECKEIDKNNPKLIKKIK